MKRKFCKLLTSMLTFVLLLNTTAFAVTEPTVTAESAILLEATTGKVIYKKDIHKKMYPASMTKILTALVTLDYFNPDALITVGEEINEVTLDSSKAGHEKGETLSVENLIRGLIIPSGNDSANVLAAAVAKKVKNDESLSYEACEKIFTGLMNEKAKKLGAKDTHFSNAHGYHEAEHYTSAYDMALFARTAMKNKTIRKIAAEKSFSGDGAGNSLEQDTTLKVQNYNWKSHNLLITDNEYQYEYAIGIKTGFTDEAGHCVAAAAEKDGKTLIAIIFKSPDPNRWLDAKNLFEYGFNHFDFAKLEKAGEVVESVALAHHNRLGGDTLDVVVKNDVKEYMATDDINKLKKVVTYNADLVAANKDKNDTTIRLKAPIAKGAEVGTVSYELDGKTVKKVKIYAASEIQKRTIGNTLKYFFKNLFSHIFSVKGLIVFGVIIVILIIIFLIMRIMGNRRRRSHYSLRSSRRRRRF